MGKPGSQRMLPSAWGNSFLARVRKPGLTWLGFALAYAGMNLVLGAVLGLPQGLMPIHWGAGLALGLGFWWGEGILLGVGLGEWWLQCVGGQSLGLGLMRAMTLVGMVLFTWRYLKIQGFSPALNRVRDGMTFIGGAVLGLPLFKTGLDSVLAVGLHVVTPQDGMAVWGQAWLSVAGGIALMTPLVLRLKLERQHFWQRYQAACQCWETYVGFGSLLAIAWFLFASHHLAVNPWNTSLRHAQLLEYLPLPGVVWAAIRFPTWGGVMASLMVALLAIAGFSHHEGSFILQSQNVWQAGFVLQTFILIMTVTGLLLSVAIKERQALEEKLRINLDRNRLLSAIALKIRQSLELEEILVTAVTEVREMLQADRVYIGFQPDQAPFQMVAESVNGLYPSMMGTNPETYQEILQYLPRQSLVIPNVTELKVTAQRSDYYQQYQVKAVLAIPLIAQEDPIGLLVCHQCSRSRVWQKGEVSLLEQLATQVAIAVQQAQLYQQVRKLNHNLEVQVQERTVKLEEKMLELEDLQQMKAVFLQAVSHDLRTSMMGLLMLFKNLQNRSGESITLSRPILERLIQSGDRQLTLLNALAEDHFAEHHPPTLQQEPLDIPSFLGKLSQDWQSLLQQNQATLSYQLPHYCPPLNADRHYLRQVFDQLLSNALKHNPPGIQLTLTLTFGQSQAYFSLKDTGLGMNREQCHQLFRVYLRSTYNHRLTGIGLGSYQCRQIIEAHGGQIGVKSMPHQGSEFWFTLPLANYQSFGKTAPAAIALEGNL